MSNYQKQAENANQCLEEAIQILANVKTSGQQSVSKLSSNRDTLAKCICTSNDQIDKKSDLLVGKIETLMQSIMNKAIEIDKRIAREEERRRQDATRISET